MTLLRAARSPATMEDAAAFAAAAPEAVLAAAGTSAPGAETLAGPSQDPFPGPQLLAKAPGKAPRPRSPGRGDSPARAGSSDALSQFKVGTPLQEAERAWNLGLPTGWGDSRSSGAGDSGAAGHSRSSLVSDMSGLSASGSVLGPGLGAAVLRGGFKGAHEGGGAQLDLPQPAGDPGAAGEAMAQGGSQVCTDLCIILGRWKKKSCKALWCKGQGPRHRLCS